MLKFEKVAFENFKKKQKCKVFCRLMELTDLAWKFRNTVAVNAYKFCLEILKLYSSVTGH